jgi:Rrf2 family protein
MKLITRDTDYALRALGFIAREPRKITSVALLVAQLRIPRPFLRKILQILNKEGIVKSYKGVGGGFALARSAKDILLTDIIEIFQGPLVINECVFKKARCPNVAKCILRKKIEAIERKVCNDLQSITMRSLIN